MTHSAPPVFPDFPTQETPNVENAFASGDTVYLALYLRDQIAGKSLNLKILRPDASIFAHWNFDLVNDFSASYWYWSSEIPTISGDWTWRVTYQGQVVDHKFTMGILSVNDEDFQTASIYPNPFNDIVTIKSNRPVKKVSVVDILGKTVMSSTNTLDGIKEINLKALSNGLYFLTLEGDENQKKIIKLIKE